MFELLNPNEIERRSFDIITEELGNISLDPLKEPVIKRAIHTSADFDYLENLYFAEAVVQKAVAAIKNGADILTDTNMAKAGINKAGLQKFGGKVHCFMADESIARKATERNLTRAAVCMEKALELKKNLIIAVGNAPTALIKLRELCDQGLLEPKLVIAVPVGFVNVVQAKELFVNYKIPAVVARGRKGGSNIAAAVCNAFIYMSRDSEQYGL